MGSLVRNHMLPFLSLHDILQKICDNQVDDFDPSSQSAPSAITTLFMNEAIGTNLPRNETWCIALNSDPMMHLMTEMVSKPSRVTNENLQKRHTCTINPSNHPMSNLLTKFSIFEKYWVAENNLPKFLSSHHHVQYYLCWISFKPYWWAYGTLSHLLLYVPLLSFSWDVSLL